MVRVRDLQKSLDFYCGALGLVESSRAENEKGKYTLVFLAAPADSASAQTSRAPLLELTHNWDGESETFGGGRNFGHLAYRVADIYAACQKLAERGVVINRPPRDGRMAFVRSPDGISVELLQAGDPLPPAEPWQTMPNTGEW